MQVEPDDPLSQDFFTTDFDDADWPDGRGAFGNDDTICPDLLGTIHTHWDESTDLLLRKQVEVPVPGVVTLFYAIDNDATIYFNGSLISDVQHGGCPSFDDYMVEVPGSLLVEGENLIAVHARDYGALAYFDLRMDARSISTYLVRPDGTGDYPTIQAAVNAAADWDTVELADGIFTGDGNRDIDYFGKRIVVRSQSDIPERCVIDCDGSETDPGFRRSNDALMRTHRATSHARYRGAGRGIALQFLTRARQRSGKWLLA